MGMRCGAAIPAGLSRRIGSIRLKNVGRTPAIARRLTMGETTKAVFDVVLNAATFLTVVAAGAWA
jgi:hypothetical protein